MVTITLKGREIPLLFTTLEMAQVQKEIGPWEKMLCMVTGKNPDDQNDKSLFAGHVQIESVAKMIKIFGNAALEEAGKPADLTEKWIMRAMKPGQLAEMVNLCTDAIAEGMASEIPEKEDDGPVDVILEEMKKKKEEES